MCAHSLNLFPSHPIHTPHTNTTRARIFSATLRALASLCLADNLLRAKHPLAHPLTLLAGRLSRHPLGISHPEISHVRRCGLPTSASWGLLASSHLTA
eukprot:scaffold132560_cov35-Tisochrysis_lutea.AAC.2